MSNAALQLPEQAPERNPLNAHADSNRVRLPDADGSSGVSCLVFDGRDASLAEQGMREKSAGWRETIGTTGAISELWEQEEFHATFLPLLQRCLGGQSLSHEIQIALPTAGWRRFELNLYPCTIGGHLQAVTVIRDVTERTRAESDLRLLLQIVHVLSTSTDLAVATTTILERLCEASGWPIGEVWIPTPDGSLQLFSAARRPGCRACEQFLLASLGLTFPRDQGLPGQLWADGSPTFIPSLDSSRQFLRSESAESAGFTSAFAIPLKSNEHTVALMLFFLSEARPPDAAWLTLARAVAAEFGTVFQREWTQEQLDCFFNRSLDMHCLAGFDGYFKRVNPAWARTLGYTTAELLKRPCVELIHSDDRPLFMEMLGKLSRGLDLTAIELRCLCQDGSIKWTLWSATSLPSQQLIVATSRDTSERKRTEIAVLQSEEHYRDLFHQAYQMQENLRRLSDRMLEIQEQERSRISRDLHDEVGQSLTAINMNLAVLRNTLAGGPMEIERRISDTQRLIEHTMATIHNFSRELRPAMLDDLGLMPALRTYVQSFIERTGLSVHLHAGGDDEVEHLGPERKVVIYRVVQEGLNNIAKHAAASEAEVRIAGAPREVKLEIRDNGRGFSQHQSNESSSGLGLLGLAERVRLVGGEFSIASAPGQGTILHASIPITDA